MQKVKIIKNRQISENARLLTFDYSPEFKPGQILSLTTNRAIPPRLYSICSAPGGEYLDVLYTVKPDGILSPLLAKLKPGDVIWASGPSGEFIMEHNLAWWIATGTGIAPFYSMFLSGFNPLKLIHGGRTLNDLYFKDEFEDKIPYVACCSRANEVGIFAGRLTQYLAGLPQLPANIYYYLCGSAEMIVDVRNLLIERGIPFDQIITEIYF